MRRLWSAALALVLLLLPCPVAAEPGDVIATGHITAGVLLGHTAWSQFLFGSNFGPGETPYQFTVDVADLHGTTLETLVDDQAGLGYFVEMAFYPAGGAQLKADCESTDDSHALLQEPIGSAELRFRCVVPADAVDMVVHAHLGVALDVTVVQVA